MTHTTPTEAAAQRMISPYVFPGCFMDSPYPNIISSLGIIESFCRAENIKLSQLRSSNRERRLVKPRHALMYLIRKHTGKSFSEIGIMFGGRHHTTVVHAYNEVENKILSDKEYSDWVDSIELTNLPTKNQL